MVCSHLNYRVETPTASSKVYKDECTLCFESLESENGVNVCLTCFEGTCWKTEQNHSLLHFEKFAHPLVLNIKKVLKKTPEKKEVSSRLKVSNEDEHNFDVFTKVVCVPCNEEVQLTPTIQSVAESIKSAVSAKTQAEIHSWQEETLKPCSHAHSLEQQPKSLKGTSNCNDCDLKENLWLCLTCGNLGCGRAQYGGIGGNSHGLKHNETTGHPLAVKIGSITPEGTADVFCYTDGDEVIDPELGKHLSAFGINLSTQQKTEKSVAELQLEQNLKFDFSMTTVDGKDLQPVFGPGFTGLKNLGNSCYLASVLQVLFSIPSFIDRYFPPLHALECREKAADCFYCQMGKLADGLLSGRYSTQIEERGQDGISPNMFKNIIGKGHPEFSSMRQQDAQEFLSFILSKIQQKERATGSDPTKCFDASMEQKKQCLECEHVGYNVNSIDHLILQVPNTPTHPLVSSLSQYFESEFREISCPVDKSRTTASFTNRFSSFPDILVLNISRFILGENWVLEKVNVELDVPNELDLNAFRSEGRPSHEKLLPETVDEPAVDQEALLNLTSMGFPESRCKKALLATGNSGAEAAMEWLFSHMDEPDDAPSDVNVQPLMDMGFTEAQAKRALKETNNNMERAVDWLFSHADEPMQEDVGQTVTVDTLPANYTLLGFISHKGTSAHCGHYIACVKKQGKWIMFNDNKVVELPDISPYIGQAYIYFYQRNKV